MKNKNLWIAVQGLDGSGKGTVIKILTDKLKQQGLRVYNTQAAGSGIVGGKLRNLYINDSESDRIKPTLSTVMHVEHYSDVVRNLTFNDYVISDRWIGCFYAYNVHTFKQPGTLEIFNNLLNNKLVMTRIPDLVIHVNASIDTIRERLQKRSNNNKLDDKVTSMLNDISEGYGKFYSNYQGPLCIIDNDSSIDSLSNKIYSVI